MDTNLVSNSEPTVGSRDGFPERREGDGFPERREASGRLTPTAVEQMSNTQRASIGRIVAFQAPPNGELQVGLIVAVNEVEVETEDERGNITKTRKETVNLVVWNGAGTQSTVFGAECGDKYGNWRWPTKTNERQGQYPLGMGDESRRSLHRENEQLDSLGMDDESRRLQRENELPTSGRI